MFLLIYENDFGLKGKVVFEKFKFCVFCKYVVIFDDYVFLDNFFIVFFFDGIF